MQTTHSPAKRSQYPFSVLLILLVHLGLGYYVYQQMTQATAEKSGTELKAIEQPAAPAIP